MINVDRKYERKRGVNKTEREKETRKGETSSGSKEERTDREKYQTTHKGTKKRKESVKYVY